MRLSGVHSKQIEDLIEKIDHFIEATQCVGALRDSHISKPASADNPIDPTSACISPPLQKTGRRVIIPSCSGYIAFQRGKHGTRRCSHGEDAVKCLRNHTFFNIPACQTHGTQNMCAWLWRIARAAEKGCRSMNPFAGSLHA